MELCTDVLQDTLWALESLPPALLFDSRSPVWSDIVNKTVRFLAGVVTSTMHCTVPSTDRQLCVALLLELAVQRGHLEALLDYAFISLRVGIERNCRNPH